MVNPNLTEFYRCGWSGGRILRVLEEAEWQEAAEAGDSREADRFRERWIWICAKQVYLNEMHYMIRDRPPYGRRVFVRERVEFGSLGPKARRPLTVDEIRWNAEKIVAEFSAATAPTPGFAPASAPATPLCPWFSDCITAVRGDKNNGSRRQCDAPAWQ